MTKNLKQNKAKISFKDVCFAALGVFAALTIRAFYDYFCTKDLVLNLSKATALISNENIVDAISFANQVGRLDLVSLLLALFGFAAFAGFLHIKETSEAIARDVARETVENHLRKEDLNEEKNEIRNASEKKVRNRKAPKNKWSEANINEDTKDK